MAKKVMEDMKNQKARIFDIVPKDNKLTSMRSVHEPVSTLPAAKKDEEEKTDVHIHERKAEYKIPATPRVRRHRSSVRKSLSILLLVVIIFGAIYWVSDLFQNAHITIKEKHQVFALDRKEYSALKDTISQVPFEIMIISDKGYKDMVLTQYENASLKAKGEITLYNEFSTKPLTLALNSFISDSTGKVYSLDKATTIPGYTQKATVVVPGTATASITSFLPGATYNLSAPTDFSINAYKGTAKFKKIYGRSTTPISGGTQGLTYTLSPEDRGIINGYAQSTFKSNLLKKVDAEVPTGYILYPNASSFSYQIDDTIQSETPNARIGVNGTISAVILKSDGLKTTVIKSLLPNTQTVELGEIDMPSLQSIAFNFVDPNQTITKDMTNFQFTLTGDLEAIWHPDVISMKQKFIGVGKDMVQSIFKSDPGIASAGVKLFPPWQSHLPVNPEKIHIKVQ
jgi:hypothetical protein